jgi:hypothetical protein
MKTNIHFYLNDKDSTQLVNIYNATFNPFNVGDKVWFDVIELYPKSINELSKQWKPDFVESYVNDIEERSKKFKNYRFKIVSGSKFIKDDRNHDDNILLEIEYHCKYCQKFYWKWWYIKYYIKKLFNIKTK